MKDIMKKIFGIILAALILTIILISIYMLAQRSDLNQNKGEIEALDNLEVCSFFHSEDNTHFTMSLFDREVNDGRMQTYKEHWNFPLPEGDKVFAIWDPDAGFEDTKHSVVGNWEIDEDGNYTLKVKNNIVAIIVKIPQGNFIVEKEDEYRMKFYEQFDELGVEAGLYYELFKFGDIFT